VRESHWVTIRGFFLLAFLLASLFAEAKIHHSQSWAENQFNKAESQREALIASSENDRTRSQYESVIAAYRRIVLESPVSTKADGSAFQIAELTAEMGRQFKDDAALFSAVSEYKFLRREYPTSKHRLEALLAIGLIYKDDLGDIADGQAALEELVRDYPKSESAQKARTELESLKAADQESDNKEQAAQSDSKKSAKKDSNELAHLVKNGELVRVTAVEHESTPDYTRVTIDLEQDVEFVSQHIDNPERIFFDLKNAYVTSALKGKSFDVDDGLVKKIRVAQFQPGKARIVIETDEDATYNASLVLNPPRLIIDVHYDDTAAKPTVVASAKKADAAADSGAMKPTATSERAMLPAAPGTPKKIIVEVDDDPAPDDAPVTPKKTSPRITKAAARSSKRQLPALAREAEPTSTGDRSLIRALGLKIGKIVIDPGHGGHDTGTIGPHGLLEKDLVLDVSRRLGKLLEARLGAGVVFTRRDDTFIPLETRTSIANQEQADLFVSVHANSSRDPDARGVETYYLNFTSSPEALEVAARENAASDKDIHELQDLVKKIALREKIDESREFAADVQQSLHSGLAAKNAVIRDRGVKKAPFVVLIGANMPSVLAEISFLSNPADEKRLKSAEYRQRIAESLYRGISRYVNGLGGIKVASKMEKASAD
jgi:N-acetylmuramoyl-L-alanine amidase